MFISSARLDVNTIGESLLPTILKAHFEECISKNLKFTMLDFNGSDWKKFKRVEKYLLILCKKNIRNTENASFMEYPSRKNCFLVKFNI